MGFIWDKLIWTNISVHILLVSMAHHLIKFLDLDVDNTHFKSDTNTF